MSMKIGVRAHDFGRKSEDELARVIHEAGFECVQLALTKAITGIDRFDMIKEGHVEKIREAFLKEDVEISVLGCYIEPAAADKETRLEQVKTFCDGVRFAKLLGAPVIATETTRFPAEGAEDQREEAYLRLKDSVLRMAETAEKEDVMIGIEPVAVHTLNNPQLARRLQNEVGSGKLKIVFDPVNMLLPHTVEKQRGIYAEFMEILGDSIVAMHIKDVAIEGSSMDWRNIGDGIVDFHPVMDWLMQNKPDIRLLREHVKLDSYKKDIEAMRKLAGI